MKICIITSTRADFGLLKNLIFKIQKNKNFILKIIASGTHFSKKYGYTFTKKQLIKWGFKFHELKMYKPFYDIMIDDKSLFYKKKWHSYLIK